MPDNTDDDIRRWADTAAITDLIYRYTDAVTRADWPQAEGVFAPDAVWESPLLNMYFENARAFLEMLKDSPAIRDALIQTVSAPVVRLMGPDRATATTTVTEIVRGSEVDGTSGEAAPVNIVQWGVYDDEIQRLDGTWLFTHRCFVPMYVVSNAPMGDVIAPRTSLAALRKTADPVP